MNSRRETVLLGAGASAKVGVPTAAAMTRRMVDAAGLRGGPNFAIPALWVLGLVVGELQAARWRNGAANDDGDINVEAVFNAVAMLADRDRIDAAPFVGQWRREVQEVDRSFLDSEDVEQIKHAMYAANSQKLFGIQDVDVDAFASAVRIALEGKGTAFKTTSEWMVEQLFDMTVLAQGPMLDGHRTFLKAAHARGATVATLNYDNALELAAMMEGIPCSLGVRHWPTTAKLEFDEGTVPLLKLHGSILWWDAVNASKATRSVVPAFSWGKLDPSPDELNTARSYGKPVLLFGGRNKLTADGPFLDLLSDFKRRLWESADLRVVGYGFGDDHVNATIARWLETGTDRRLHVNDIRSESDVLEAIGERIRRFGPERVVYNQWTKRTSLARVFGAHRQTK